MLIRSRGIMLRRDDAAVNISKGHGRLRKQEPLEALPWIGSQSTGSLGIIPRPITYHFEFEVHRISTTGLLIPNLTIRTENSITPSPLSTKHPFHPISLVPFLGGASTT